jgi:hypothetical protein
MRRSRWNELIARCRQAELDPSAFWIQFACLMVGAVGAWVAASSLAWAGNDLEEARRLGIISATTLAGYPKSRDIHAYLLAVIAAVAIPLALWLAWCGFASRRRDTIAAPSVPAAPPPVWRRTELFVVALVLMLGLFRRELALNGWDASYTFYAEEGQALAWADAALHGGVLARDIYCLYGPLATLPVVGAFKLFGATVDIWRSTFYLLDVPALLAVYALLRQLGSSRLTAWGGVMLILLHRMWPMPGMSWCLLRTGLGLAALTAVLRFLRTRRRRALAIAGALLGVAMFFSQEAGIAAGVGAAMALGLDHAARRSDAHAIGSSVAVLAAGFALAAAAVLAPFAWHGAVGSLLDNLSGFAKLRVLGHGGQRLPALFGGGESFFETCSLYVGPALYVATVFHTGVRLLGARYTPELATRLGLAAYGAVLFVSPLSRPDTTHLLFAMPPAFVLAVDLLARLSARASRSPEPARTRAAYAAAVVAIVLALATFQTDTLENATLFARQVASNLLWRDPAAAPEDARALVLPRAGGVRVPADRAAEIEGAVAYVVERTAPAEPVWTFPNEPMLGFLADRPPASPYPLTLFAVTRDQRLDLIDAVERSGARYAIVNERTSMVDGIPSRQQNPEPWEYLERRFTPERHFGRLVVMRRTPATPPR